MIKFLEDLLYQKTKDSQSEILFAQWNYDKKVIPVALQAVSNLFPHYSLHDESHSITIINNIVRVVGKDNIIKMSAIDIWLILEAAYCHDIGMVVSSEKIAQALNSLKFIDFFKDLIADSKNGLHEFAIQFKIVDNKIKYKNDSFDIQLNDGIKFILAEYFRRAHAERSREIIIDPLRELSIVSPRGVIPPRIFKILGDICSSHTKDFEDVLNLPFCEVGIDIEDAHPKFVACLLRVGDLLDLDNNRFSEVMLRTLSRVPIDTLNHKSKHLSIESFRLDQDKIEIKAKCKDYDTANITQHWFNFLNSEISLQMINWNDIVPFKELCYLPTIGVLQVELADYEFIDGKNKPKFSVDTDKALDLLQGAGIYDSSSQCIREILQNSVDATLMRIWLEYSEKIDLSYPNSDDFIELKKKYPISVNIIKDAKDTIWQNWIIEIQDNGIGISTEDLKFLMKTGSSSKNKSKSSIVETMPVWLRPSGTFGIGFQSIFMLTDFVKIETKSFSDEQFQIIELNSPDSKKDGDILIQKKKTNHSIKPFTKITITYRTKLIPERYSYSIGRNHVSKIVKNYDPFINESLDIELAKIRDEVFEFSKKSYLPLDLYVEGKRIKLHETEEKIFQYYDKESFLELNVLNSGSWETITYYKNQIAENRMTFLFLAFEINIHKEKASEVLTLNRNKIKEDYGNDLFSQVLRASFKCITENFYKLFKTPEAEALGSMFLHYYSERDEVKDFDINDFNQWQNFEINLSDKKISLQKLLDITETLKLISINNSDSRIYDDLYSLRKKELTIEFSSGQSVHHYTQFLLERMKLKLNSVVKETDLGNHNREIIYSKKILKIEFKQIKDILINLKKGYSHTARKIIPCPEEFLELRIRSDARLPFVRSYGYDTFLGLPYPKMVSPFVEKQQDNEPKFFEVVLNEKLLKWVYDNRFDPKITLEEIKKGYEEFINKIDLDEINLIE